LIGLWVQSLNKKERPQREASFVGKFKSQRAVDGIHAARSSYGFRRFPLRGNFSQPTPLRLSHKELRPGQSFVPCIIHRFRPSQSSDQRRHRKVR
jgi:hypothetical protein